MAAPDFAVIFDMDGVLVDSNEAHFKTFQEMATLLGRPFPPELWARSIGMHNNAIFPLWLGEDLPPARARELALQKEALYRERAASQLKPIEGIPELVLALAAARVPLAVGSSGPRLNVELALRVLGVGGRLGSPFGAVVCGDDVKHGKPNPEIFLLAASRLGVAPSRCVVLEDAPQGIAAGKAAGMTVVGLATTCGPEQLAGADLVVKSPRELDFSRLRELL